MIGEVPIELRTLLEFRFKLQLDELFDGFWAFVRGVVSRIYIKFVFPTCLVDDQGSDRRSFVHAYDLSALSCCGMRLGRLPGKRIWCYLQALYIALSCLLLVCLDSYNLPDQSREFHFQIGHGDYGSKLVVNQSKI